MAPLCPILPILFYHGKSKQIPTDFELLFAKNLPKELENYIPRFLCEIFNLTSLPDNQLEGPPELEAALWAMKYARTQVDLALKAFDRLAASLGKVFIQNPSFREIELYLFASSGLTPEQILDKINKLIHDKFMQEEIMSTAEMLMARGEARGEARGKLETAKRMMEDEISIEIIAKYTGLSVSEIEKIYRQ